MTITVTVSNDDVRARILNSRYVTDVEINVGMLIRTKVLAFKTAVNQALSEFSKYTDYENVL